MKNSVVKQKKILLVIWGGIHYGGVSILLYNLLNHMNRSSINIDLYAFGNIESQEVFDKLSSLGINIILGKHESYIPKSIFFDLSKLMKTNKYDVVHCNTGGLELTAITMILSWIYRVPVRIAHSHNQKLNEFPYSKKERIYQQINTKMSTLKLACSKAAAQHMFGINGSQSCSILKNGIELKKYLYDENIRIQIRNQIEKQDSLIIGHIGRFEAQKNHQFLIEIFYSIKQKRDNALLMLIGTGSLMNTIKEKVKYLGIEDSIFLVGTTDKVQDYLQAMDVFVLPSKSEGLGIVAVEAQAADLLTICSDTVPQEAKVSSKMKFFSLDKTPEQWSDMILSEIERIDCNNRMNRSQEIKETGYDIENSALELYHIYMIGALEF